MLLVRQGKPGGQPVNQLRAIELFVAKTQREERVGVRLLLGRQYGPTWCGLSANTAGRIDGQRPPGLGRQRVKQRLVEIRLLIKRGGVETALPPFMRGRVIPLGHGGSHPGADEQATVEKYP